MYVSSLFIVVTWRSPLEAGHVFRGVAALSASVMVVNGLWVALIVALGIAWFLNPVRLGKWRFIALMAALGLVALLQCWAVLVREAAFG